MNSELKFYQINLNKCEAAQANLMVELNEFKDKQFVCLIQEPHFYGTKPSSKVWAKKNQTLSKIGH